MRDAAYCFFCFFFLSQVGLEKGQVLGLGLGLKLHPQPVCFLGSFSGSRLWTLRAAKKKISPFVCSPPVWKALKLHNIWWVSRVSRIQIHRERTTSRVGYGFLNCRSNHHRHQHPISWKTEFRTVPAHPGARIKAGSQHVRPRWTIKIAAR